MTEARCLTISNFTDPMMGLSYESEPFLRKLETHFAGRIQFRYVMSGLVRDVYDFVDPADLRLGKEVALRRYNARLAKIYEAEEDISGMPINMSDLQLFSTEHTSSLPLNLAYKAAQLADPAKADVFLYNIRYATIVECRPTTRFPEIMRVVGETGISSGSFMQHYEDGSAQAALDDDFRLRQELGVHRLPAYLFEYSDRRLMASGVLDYGAFVEAIKSVTDGELKAVAPELTLEAIRQLVDLHPLISPIEIREAFDLQDVEEVRQLILPLVVERHVRIETVHHGWFIRKM